MKFLRLFAFAIGLLPVIARSDENPQAGNHHVVILVWDGMRPDLVSEKYTPTLWKLARAGVTFRHHHSSYLSATEVNGAAIATGCYPSHNGVFANYIFRPEIEAAKMIDVANPSVVRKGDEVSGGAYLNRPTIAEILHRAGKRTAIAGTKPVTLLLDRRAGPDNEAAKKSFVLFQGTILPNESADPFSSALGLFPGLNDPHADDWTTRALTDVMWKESLPEYSLLWLREPDHAQHKTAPGSPESIAAMASADQHLHDVLDSLERKGERDRTDVFVVSDHGFSTIAQSIDLLPLLRGAGFRAVTQITAPPRRGDIMVVGNGGSVLFYVSGHDAAVTRRLVAWLQQTTFAGVIFSRDLIDGTFDLNVARIDGLNAPDVIMAFRWNAQPNQFGVPGMIDADWNRKSGAGTHATLSAFDMHNTLIAAGPDFRRGMVDQLPSGNIDLVPTILRILNVTAPEKFDGRILSEAMTGEQRSAPSAQTEMKEAVRDLGNHRWRQYLQISRVESTVYLNEGNGESRPEEAKSPPAETSR